MGVKLASLGHWPVLGDLAVESGIFAFLFLVILSSAVAELFGQATANRMVRYGFIPLIVSMVLLTVVIRLVPPAPFSNPGHFVHTSRRLAEETEGAVWANQFDNIANRKAHIESTAPEIWAQLEGRVDGFICAAGTGGNGGGAQPGPPPPAAVGGHSAPTALLAAGLGFLLTRAVMARLATATPRPPAVAVIVPPATPAVTPLRPLEPPPLKPAAQWIG